jgi:PKD repeat protein
MPAPRSAVRAALAVATTILAVATCREVQGPTTPLASDSARVAVPALTEVAPEPTSPASTASVVLVGAGDIASCSTENDEATAKLLDGIAGEVFTLGDNAYASGTAAEYTGCYGPTWGRHKARTHPSAGDKDYTTAGAPGYFGYFGAAAGDPAKGYYSYDVGDWHVVVLNGKVSTTVTSPQIAWLKSDLAASTKVCTIAYWHKPRFYSNGVSANYKPAWDVLYSAGAELVLNADRKNYERFAPQNPDGIADPAYGIRQFVVGTGGASSSSFGTPLANSEVRIASTPGVLELTLDAAGYSWRFVPIAGKTLTDQGTGTCHGPPPPVARPGGPYRSESTVSFDGSTSSDPQGDLPLTYEWSFGDGATGTGATPTHSYDAFGDYTVTLVVTDSKGNRSNPATTTVSIASLPPTVEAGPEPRATTGEAISYAGSFTDGPNGTPWSYRIAWGDNSADYTGTVTEAGPVGAPHTYAAAGDYTLTLTVTDAQGSSASDQTVVHVRDPGAAVTLLAAGDIAECGSNVRDTETAKLIEAEVATHPGAVVFTLGDNAYPNGRTQDYTNCYDPAWGRLKSRTYANIGNHDYDTGNANATWDYFGDRAGPRGKGYYSVDLGDWHIIVLNDNKSFVPFASGSAQDTWLQADLAANTKRCTLAIWHQPRFYSSESSTTVRTAWKILWDRLWAAGVELVLNGHQHRYERFAPMRPDGTRDDVTGIKQFIVGTGGEGTASATYMAANSEVVAATIGIIKLTLRQDGYDWQFKPIPGQTFTDSGSGTCH